MVDIPEAEAIADLEKILRETRFMTALLDESIKLHMVEHTTIHPLVIEQARATALELEEAMSLNALLFEAKPEDTERRLRSELDDAFRAKKNLLKELTRIPPDGDGSPTSK